jgi:hypothetical protein
VIVLEDLHVRGMQQNKRPALSIRDAGIGERRGQLAYKSEWCRSTLIVADRFYPTSKLCSGCGAIKDALSLSEHVFDCEACGLSIDRDENAARRKACRYGFELGLSVPRRIRTSASFARELDAQVGQQDDQPDERREAAHDQPRMPALAHRLDEPAREQDEDRADDADRDHDQRRHHDQALPPGCSCGERLHYDWNRA